MKSFVEDIVVGRWTVAYLGGGGHWAMAPFEIFFYHWKKIENLVWPLFVWALVASENFPLPFEVLNTPLSMNVVCR